MVAEVVVTALLLAGIPILLLMTLALAPYHITCAVQKKRGLRRINQSAAAHWRCCAAQHGTLLPVHSTLQRPCEMGNRNQLI